MPMPQWLTKTKEWLTRVVSTAIENAATDLIRAGVLALVGLGGSALVLGSFWQSTRELLQTPLLAEPIQAQAWHLLSFVLLLMAAFLLGILYKAKKSSKPKDDFYFFVTHGGLKWRARKFDGEVDYMPFCPKHQVELLQDRHTLYCAQCKKTVAGFEVVASLAAIRKAAENEAEARSSGHYVE